MLYASIPILFAFALPDKQPHIFAVNIRNTKITDFGHPQAGTVDVQKNGAVFDIINYGKELRDFFHCEYFRVMILSSETAGTGIVDVLTECTLQKKADCTVVQVAGRFGNVPTAKTGKNILYSY